MHEVLGSILTGSIVKQKNKNLFTQDSLLHSRTVTLPSDFATPNPAAVQVVFFHPVYFSTNFPGRGWSWKSSA
jgi:hypothetical protein